MTVQFLYGSMTSHHCRDFISLWNKNFYSSHFGFIYRCILYFFTDQRGLGGCLYILDCCLCEQDEETHCLQWFNSRLLIMNQLMDEFSTTFAQSENLMEVTNKTLIPITKFSVKALLEVGQSSSRTRKLSKRLILVTSKWVMGSSKLLSSVL